MEKKKREGEHTSYEDLPVVWPACELRTRFYGHAEKRAVQHCVF
jgi:hypothetical protein